MLLELLRDQFPFTAAQWEQYIPCFQRVEVPAHTTLLAEGEIARRIYFIEKGCLRLWFNSQGKDVTFQFFFEQQTVSSLESFHYRTPSPFALETLEPCTLWWLSRPDAYAMVRELGDMPQAREKLAGFMFGRARHYMTHCVSLIRDTPRQRYQELLTHSPQVVQRVPQHYIASYLGISTVHLSRVKK